MQTVTVNKHELLAILKNNRQEHHEIFLEAQEGYRKAIITELDQMLADARNGKKIRRAIQLVEPMDQTSDYDRAIRMVEMSIKDEIELSEHDFSCLVLDQWDWHQRWSLANSAYSPKLSGKMEQS